MSSSERGHLDVALRRDLTLNLSWGECVVLQELARRHRGRAQYPRELSVPKLEGEQRAEQLVLQNLL